MPPPRITVSSRSDRTSASPSCRGSVPTSKTLSSSRNVSRRMRVLRPSIWKSSFASSVIPNSDLRSRPTTSRTSLNSNFAISTKRESSASAPKGETQLTPEERLLHAIFGEKAKDVKDTSMRMEGGKRGRVVSVKVFSRENGDVLESGVIKRVHVEVAQLRTISVGDKLAGRHGNKGVISRVLPEEDMPFDESGNPVDIILTPLGVPSRMNLGQILELHLGLAAEMLGYQAVVPSFAGATDAEIQAELKKAGENENGKRILFDGLTGEAFAQPVSVGIMYILKLHHMVEDKIHMRSIGPYSLTTQQPLGGKAQNGGQRVGEMEVWAFLGYGAAYSLREILTIKSDDILGRSAAFDAIVSGKRIEESNTPATFNVLVRHLRGLGIDMEFKGGSQNF